MNEMPNWSNLLPGDGVQAVGMSTSMGGGSDRRSFPSGFLRPRAAEHAVLVVDVLLIIGMAVLCDLVYRVFGGVREAAGMGYVPLALIVAVNFTVPMVARRNYRLKRLMRFSTQAKETVVVWCAVFCMLASVAFAMKVGDEYSRGSALLAFSAGLVSLVGWRYVASRMISRAVARGAFARHRCIVVAEQGQIAKSRPMIEMLRHGCHPVRVYEISHAEMEAPGLSSAIVAKFSELADVARGAGVEDVYLLIGWQNHRKIESIVDALSILPIPIHLVPDESAARFLGNPISHVGGTWTAEVRRAPLTRAEQAIKRAMDVVFGVVALAMLSPLMLMAAVAVKLDSPGPVFFRQGRNGFNDRLFNIYKFRSMRVMEDGAVVRQAVRNDPRVTAAGAFLRRSSIDELPQLLNVIRGEMSMVGPRPHAVSHNTEYEKLIARYAFRHHVKPGITGWAQVNGFRGETPQIEMMEKRVDHDLWYINNWSPWLDVKILLMTAIVALRQPTAY